MNQTRPETFWTDERVEELRRLWNDEEMSASQIARAMGAPSRNSVLSKIHRSGLNLRQGNRPRLPVSRGPALRAPRPIVEKLPVVELPPVVLETGEHITLMTVGDRYCRWPIGDPRDADFYFCGNKPIEGGPYCEAHHRTAHQPRQSLERAPHTAKRYWNVD
jgi:GcrA cell cycle regulator